MIVLMMWLHTHGLGQIAAAWSIPHTSKSTCTLLAICTHLHNRFLQIIRLCVLFNSIRNVIWTSLTSMFYINSVPVKDVAKRRLWLCHQDTSSLTPFWSDDRQLILPFSDRIGERIEWLERPSRLFRRVLDVPDRRASKYSHNLQ